jgi:predicted transcriptional regulator
MAVPREFALAFIGDLPDDATWADVEYQVSVAAGVAEGTEDLEAGRTFTTEQLRRLLLQPPPR